MQFGFKKTSTPKKEETTTLEPPQLPKAIQPVPPSPPPQPVTVKVEEPSPEVEVEAEPRVVYVERTINLELINTKLNEINSKLNVLLKEHGYEVD